MSRPEKPIAEEREWLLTRLADLVAEGRFERLVGAPLVEGSARWFPDRWSPTAAGVRVLLRRLLFHAGLADLEVEVADHRVRPADAERIGYSEVVYAGHAGKRVEFDHRRRDPPPERAARSRGRGPLIERAAIRGLGLGASSAAESRRGGGAQSKTTVLPA
jgi:hypothetical protein